MKANDGKLTKRIAKTFGLDAKTAEEKLAGVATKYNYFSRPDPIEEDKLVPPILPHPSARRDGLDVVRLEALKDIMKGKTPQERDRSSYRARSSERKGPSQMSSKEKAFLHFTSCLALALQRNDRTLKTGRGVGEGAGVVCPAAGGRKTPRGGAEAEVSSGRRGIKCGRLLAGRKRSGSGGASD